MLVKPHCFVYQPFCDYRLQGTANTVFVCLDNGIIFVCSFEQAYYGSENEIETQAENMGAKKF